VLRTFGTSELLPSWLPLWCHSPYKKNVLFTFTKDEECESIMSPSAVRRGSTLEYESERASENTTSERIIAQPCDMSLSEQLCHAAIKKWLNVMRPIGLFTSSVLRSEVHAPCAQAAAQQQQQQQQQQQCRWQYAWQDTGAPGACTWYLARAPRSPAHSVC
jgi:hypothetical protein